MRHDAGNRERSDRAGEASPPRLPGCSALLVDAAQRCAADAAALLTVLDAPWIAASADAAGAITVGAPLGRDAAACAPIDRRTAHHHAPLLHRLEQSARTVIDALALRWPLGAAPARIGVVSDGVGLGFSPEDPCPLEPDWLTRLCLGDTALVAILPFSVRTLALLGQGASASRH